MSSENPYASPNSDAPPVMAQPEVAPTSSTGPWQRRGTVVAARGVPFPERCVKCNQPTGGRTLRRTLAWHPGWVFVLILAGLLVYVIVALILRKSMTVRVGICPAHLKRHRILLGGGLLSIALSITVPIVLGNFTRIEPGLLVMLGIMATILTSIFTLLAVRFVSPSMIDDRFAWIKNTGREFRHSLPEWTWG